MSRRRRTHFYRTTQSSPQYEAFLDSLPGSTTRSRRARRKTSNETGLKAVLASSWEEGREARESFVHGLKMAVIVLVAIFGLFGLFQIADDITGNDRS